MSRVVVIGASTGGVPALMQLTAGLSDRIRIDVPILIVMHVGANESILPTLLERHCALDVAHAVHGEGLRGGAIRIAPPDHHMVVSGDRIELTRGPKENHARPAIDPLFRSVALSHGPGVIGVVLTGQLDDGTAGLQAIKQRGGSAIVQDPADAAEPGMPTSALRHVDVDHCVPLPLIPMLIETLASQPLKPAMEATDSNLQHEVDLANGAGNPVEHLQAVGRPSPFACPDCHGGLWQLLDSRPPRYRCHTGHAFTERSLRQALAGTSDEAVWNAMRALQERQILYEHMAQLNVVAGDSEAAEPLLATAKELKRQVEVLRELTEQLSDSGE